jgi:hypothetical protein
MGCRQRDSVRGVSAAVGRCESCAAGAQRIDDRRWDPADLAPLLFARPDRHPPEVTSRQMADRTCMRAFPGSVLGRRTPSGVEHDDVDQVASLLDDADAALAQLSPRRLVGIPGDRREPLRSGLVTPSNDGGEHLDDGRPVGVADPTEQHGARRHLARIAVADEPGDPIIELTGLVGDEQHPLEPALAAPAAGSTRRRR